MSDEKKPDKELELFGSRILEPVERPPEERSPQAGKTAPVALPEKAPAMPPIVVDDPTALGFFRKVYDPAAYATPEISAEAMVKMGFAPKVFYDTETFSTTQEISYFAVPRGQGGKTELETNLDVGGQLTFGNQVFVFSTVIFRFVVGESPACSQVWQKGFLSFEKYNSRIIGCPVSSMGPLYPRSEVRGIFFWVDRVVWQFPNDWFMGRLYFPAGLDIRDTVKIRIELYGLMSNVAGIYLAQTQDGRIRTRSPL